MLEKVNYDDLVEGQMYCVIDNFLGRKKNLIFVVGSFFKYPDSNFDFQLYLTTNTFYRYVSNYEYYMALKEKYDSNCLDIVLKRLIDESFQW